MNFEPVERLAGTRDLAGEEFASVDSLRLAMGAALSNAGYGRIETPILEKADLFFRKSGAEINSSLYSFTDPGGVKVSLRPEFTSSVIRSLIQDTESGSGPFRRSYSGPVFRYGEGPFRQMTQVGGELVGLAEPAADAEIIGLAVRCAQEAKIDDFTVRVGHLGVIHDVMRWFDLSEPVMMFVAGAMQGGSGLPKPSEDLLAMAQASGLVSSDDAATAADADSNVMTDESMRTLLRESIGAPIGRRTIEDVLDRLVRKKRDAAHPTSFLGAVDALRRLAKVQGRPDEVAEAARDALSCNGLPSEILENLERVVTHLEDDGFPLERLTIDLSFARGIAYYTGLVFEIQLAGPDGGVLSVGGGGRYDGLVKALGGAEDTPALGFAFTLEQILSARESSPGRQRVDGKRG